MKPFLDDDFLLHSDVARTLYHEHAESQPIYDYHCHLPPHQIAANTRFENLTEAWLAGDHYKWRAMRSNGIPEKYCTGDASPREKFQAYARTVPRLLRNPLYHWTHLELRRYFGIQELLDETTAESIWNRANEQLAVTPVQTLLTSQHVVVIATTDDPVDSLEAHRKLLADKKFPIQVYPTFRPDQALRVDQPTQFNPWVDQLANASDVACDRLDDFLLALERRHDRFHELGARLSDHGLPHAYADDCSEQEARRIFDTARAGQTVALPDADRFRSFLMFFFGQLDAAKGWTKQLHLGALRDTNTRRRHECGADAGSDSMGDWPQATALARYLDRLDQEQLLPKTVLYNHNPANNHLFSAMAGNFTSPDTPAKIQFGTAWWFLDQKDGIEQQLNALSQLGLLSHFVGMTTDSRSFLSYPRHEYFRRILCDIIGREATAGELPDDPALLGTLVSDICFNNANRYFGLALGT